MTNLKRKQLESDENMIAVSNKYHALLVKVKANKDKMRNDAEFRATICKDAQDLFDVSSLDMENSMLATNSNLDIKILRQIMSCIRECKEVGTIFDINDFATKLLSKGTVGDDGTLQELTIDKWIEIGQQSAADLQEAPALTFLYGSLNKKDDLSSTMHKSELRDNVAKKKDEEAVLTKLRSKGFENRTDETENKKIEMVYDVISKEISSRNGKPVNIFRLTLDPKSFSVSVRNLFYVSSLVKDGRILHKLDSETGIPLVKLRSIDEMGPTQ